MRNVTYVLGVCAGAVILAATLGIIIALAAVLTPG